MLIRAFLLISAVTALPAEDRKRDVSNGLVLAQTLTDCPSGHVILSVIQYAAPWAIHRHVTDDLGGVAAGKGNALFVLKVVPLSDPERAWGLPIAFSYLESALEPHDTSCAALLVSSSSTQAVVAIARNAPRYRAEIGLWRIDLTRPGAAWQTFQALGDAAETEGSAGPAIGMPDIHPLPVQAAISLDLEGNLGPAAISICEVAGDFVIALQHPSDGIRHSSIEKRCSFLLYDSDLHSCHFLLPMGVRPAMALPTLTMRSATSAKVLRP